MKSVVGHPLTLSALVLLLFSTPALAQVCSVPTGSYPTVQSAVSDTGCAEVNVATGTFAEMVTVRRSLTITGSSSASTTIEGRVVATGGGVQLALNSIKVDAGTPSTAGCFPEAVTATGGAILTGNDLVAVNSAAGVLCVFIDDFESASTGSWSSAVP